jgi:hypothetical protein
MHLHLRGPAFVCLTISTYDVLCDLAWSMNGASCWSLSVCARSPLALCHPCCTLLTPHGPHGPLCPQVSPADGAARFAVDTVVHGDVLVRGRHVGPGGAHETMFRAAFHTG